MPLRRLVLPALPLLAVVVGTFAAGPAAAQQDAPPTLVYVTDVVTKDDSLSSDAKALTAALCGAIARDVRLEVMCAPDVKQILGFAAMSAMTGAQSPAVAKLESRMSTVAYVVVPVLTTSDKKAITLTANLGPRAPESAVTSPAVSEVLFKVEEVSPGKAAALLSRLPAVANKVTGAIAQDLAKKNTPAPPPPLPTTTTSSKP